MEQFIIVLSQVVIFLILICVGILSTKLKILSKEALSGISALVMSVSLPCFIFINGITSATRQSLMDSLIIIPIAVILYLLLMVVNMMIEKVFKLKGNRERIHRACFMFNNIGFMGIPLVIAIYPDTAVLYVSIFTIVDQLVFWTYGVTLTYPVSENKQKTSVLTTLKNLISPPLVAIILAVVFILIGIQVPSVIESALSTIGATSMPLALIYIGGVVCTIDLKPALKCAEIYAGIIVKMIVVPVVAFVVMNHIGIALDMSTIMAYMVALPGVEIVAMLAEANECDGDYAVCSIMISTIASLITLPIVSLLMAAVS